MNTLSMGFEQSFSIVTNLVKDFQANEKYYTSPEYSEVDIRGDFIDKFFTALGWDVKHNVQKNPKSTIIEKLPIRLINFSNNTGSEIHTKIIELVSQMRSAKKQLQQAKTESDKEYLQRKCDSIDNQIDQLVYQLYGLTEEEIRIVEEGSNQ